MSDKKNGRPTPDGHPDHNESRTYSLSELDKLMRRSIPTVGGAA